MVIWVGWYAAGSSGLPMDHSPVRRGSRDCITTQGGRIPYSGYWATLPHQEKEDHQATGRQPNISGRFRRMTMGCRWHIWPSLSGTPVNSAASAAGLPGRSIARATRR